jgi:exodeoxyribonuclease VII large subunit
MVESPLTNAPELTVTELSGALKRTIEDQFGHVRLRGEISNYRGPHSSGHAYFCLKDANARIDAVIWKGNFLRLRTKPQEGLEVIATGKITTFPGKSSYQIVIDQLEPAGVGALMALLEERRKKLAAEGLFDEARKKSLPYLPRVIGIVTSPTGAVIRDILHRLNDRFPRHVLVWPVRVQGETSASEVAAAIRGFNALTPGGKIPRPDLLIVARGGGSLEDLWSFNEEEVLRAAAASQIPLISAIGHETDVTLLDHVADLRAPTPTGAAEKAVPVRAELLADINALSRRHAEAMVRLIDRRRSDLRSLARALPQPDSLLATPRQRQDRAVERLGSALRAFIGARRLALSEASRLLGRHAPQAELQRVAGRLNTLAFRLLAAGRGMADRRRERLAVLGARFDRAFAARLALQANEIAARRERGQNLGRRLDAAYGALLNRRRDRLGHAAKLLGAVGYRSILARGFVLVRDASGVSLRAAAQVVAGADLNLTFADGEVSAVAGAGVAVAQAAAPGEPGAKKRAPAKKPPTGGQGSLF